MEPGPKNLLADVAGLRVGHATDLHLMSGATVVVADEPFTAGVHVMGGAPGTRETDLLAPDRTVQQVDALVLSGGSAFGLDAASGVADGLAARGRGFAVGPARVPIVPGAILFDLLNGETDWAENPYKALGRSALDAALGPAGLRPALSSALGSALGSVGAGTGATVAGLRGGLGQASAVADGVTVAALAAVNALGSPTIGDGPHFWAAPWEQGTEFGGRGLPAEIPRGLPPTKLGPGTATTIAILFISISFIR